MSATSLSPAASGPAKCSLELMNLHDSDQVAELLRQRILCGWNKTPAFVTNLRDAMDAGSKAAFWITLPQDSLLSEAHEQAQQLQQQQQTRIGHVSLDSTAFPEDLTLANPYDKSVLTISNLFILSEHRRGGIARAAVDMLMKLAKEEPWGSPNCKAVAVTAHSKKYHDDDEWRARFEWLCGMPAPERGRANEDWYVRMGFVKFKEEERYPSEVPGRENEKIVASFLRKEV